MEASGLALWRFYFQIHAGSIKSPPVIEFLRHLQRHVQGKCWSSGMAHRSIRSLLVKNYVAATRGRLIVERLPAYAPELNPVEYMWGQLKTHELANLIVTHAMPGNLVLRPRQLCASCDVVRPLSPPAILGLNCRPDVTLLYED